MYNISFVDFGVTDEPVEVDETWTKTMYICLLLNIGSIRIYILMTGCRTNEVCTYVH